MQTGTKIQRIYEGWANLIECSPEVEEIAKKRAKICADCIYLRFNVCKLCRCFIPAKIRSLKEHCPLLKWKEDGTI